jgi:light-regulated signal transduction histidine kinase (bacteriophytochrome)
MSNKTISELHHDIRNQLASIKAYASLLKRMTDTDGDTRKKNYIDEINRKTDEIVTTVEQLVTQATAS